MLIIRVMEKRNELLIVDYSFAWIIRLLMDRKMSDYIRLSIRNNYFLQ
jgi:hypothetical protein